MGARLVRAVASLGLVLSMGAVSSGLALVGCGASQDSPSSPAQPRAPGTTDIPASMAAQLEGCRQQAAVKLRPAAYAVSLDVYLTSEGRAAGAHVTSSTVGDRDVEACFARALGAASWAHAHASVERRDPGPPSRALLGQPLPVPAPPDVGPISGIRPVQPPSPPAPEVPPTIVRWRLPFISPAFAGGIVFITISLWPRETAPRWLDETSPITGGPYTSPEEYEETRRLPPEEIQRRRDQIKNAKPDAGPAPTGQAPPPAPAPDPKCQKIAAKIQEIIYTVRPPTPPGGFPQGRQGLATRWREFAENKGNWGMQPNGKPSKNVDNHLKEYQKGQEELNGQLGDWKEKGCADKDLPPKAREYANQKPELGPGKPLEPKPLPPSPAPASPSGEAPKEKVPERGH